MKNFFRPIPFVRLIIPLILGISCGLYLSFPALYLLLPIILLLGFYAYQKGKTSSYVFGAIAFIGLFLMGMMLPSFHQNEDSDSHFGNFLNEDEIEWVGIVNSMPKSKNNIEADIKVESILVDGKWQTVEGKLLARFKKDESNITYQYGDRIISSSRINLNQKPTNPHSFDYSRFLCYQNIYHTTFVSKGNSKKLDGGHGWRILSWSYALRKQGLKNLKRQLRTDNEFAVGSALILGYKDEMTDEVQNAFTDTGATHVLAVSGLHVGILLIIIQFIFSLFKKRVKRNLKWVEFFTSIGIIWAFALVTGASPSVLRAATMFSFVAFGTAMDKNKHIYNTLAASAFVLLCFNPLLLFNPGFQLSYLAVIGIVFFHPIIYKSWYIENKFGNYIWNLIAVSLAAQIITIPISLFYFHQFPTYFLLSGLVVIPAAGLIMSLGILILFLGKVPFIGAGLGFLLYWLIFAVNSVVYFISQIPLGLIENIDISFLEMLLGYVSIGLLMVWISNGKHKYLMYTLFILLIGSISYSYRNINNQFNQEIVFYDSKEMLIDLNHQGIRTTCKSEFISSKNEEFASKGNRIATRNYQEGVQDYFEKEKFIQIGNQRFFILNENYFDILSMNKIWVDGIIIENNPFINFNALVEEFEFDFIIATSSNYESKVEKWRKAFDETGYSQLRMNMDTFNEGVIFYYTKEKAVILNLEESKEF